VGGEHSSQAMHEQHAPHGSNHVQVQATMLPAYPALTVVRHGHLQLLQVGALRQVLSQPPRRGLQGEVRQMVQRPARSSGSLSCGVAGPQDSQQTSMHHFRATNAPYSITGGAHGAYAINATHGCAWGAPQYVVPACLAPLCPPPHLPTSWAAAQRTRNSAVRSQRYY
jgi:hypothetical protein